MSYPVMVAPSGLEAILAAFGDPYKAMGDDGTLSAAEAAEWEKRLVAVPFWTPISLAYGKPGQVATRIRVHERVASRFEVVFRAIGADATLRAAVKTYGGGYLFRPKRSNGDDLSTHSWGIAIDLNPGTNGMGTKGDMHPGIVETFEDAGFEWGGRWRRRDDMHFQFCRRY